MLSSYDENSQALHALEQDTALEGPLLFSLLLQKLNGDTRHRFKTSRGTNLMVSPLLFVEYWILLLKLLSSCAQPLQVKRTRASRSINAISQALVNTKGLNYLNISSMNGNIISQEHPILILDKITSDLPRAVLSLYIKSKMASFVLADPTFDTHALIDILLGVDLFAQIMTGEQYILGKDLLIAFGTVFGVVLMGPNPCSAPRLPPVHFNGVTTLLSTNNIDLHSSLHNFWKLEVPPHSVGFSKKQLCEDHFVSTHTRDYSFKDSHPILADSPSNARNIFNILKRFAAQPQFKQLYVYIMEDCLTAGRTPKPCRVTDPEGGRCFSQGQTLKVAGVDLIGRCFSQGQTLKVADVDLSGRTNPEGGRCFSQGQTLKVTGIDLSGKYFSQGQTLKVAGVSQRTNPEVASISQRTNPEGGRCFSQGQTLKVTGIDLSGKYFSQGQTLKVAGVSQRTNPEVASISQRTNPEGGRCFSQGQTLKVTGIDLSGKYFSQGQTLKVAGVSQRTNPEVASISQRTNPEGGRCFSQGQTLKVTGIDLSGKYFSQGQTLKVAGVSQRTNPEVASISQRTNPEGGRCFSQGQTLKVTGIDLSGKYFSQGQTLKVAGVSQRTNPEVASISQRTNPEGGRCFSQGQTLKVTGIDLSGKYFSQGQTLKVAGVSQRTNPEDERR
uniref:(California timema) hypothetical protein n=1 Tax=Timema californicum TaxID=61474 RepID=A0A7R9P8C9_TIMCA|nr:unnamed protein product [Timema californicum]